MTEKRPRWHHTDFGYAEPMNEQSPIVSEIATSEEAAAYEEWLRAKVAASLADERPSLPHDEVMAEMRAIIEAKGAKSRRIPWLDRARHRGCAQW